MTIPHGGLGGRETSVFDFVLARGVFAVIRPDNLSAALPLAEVHHHDPSRARFPQMTLQRYEGRCKG